MPSPFNPADSDLIDDFETFLRYLAGNPNLPLTAGGDLKAADLWALNERVNYKAPFAVTPRSRQMDYPLLGFLFQVVTASRLFVIKSEKGNVLVAEPDRLDTYQSMTLEEKYVFLLETAWCYVDWGMLDGDGRSGHGSSWFRQSIEQLLRYAPGTPVTLVQNWEAHNNPFTIQAPFLSNVYVRAGHWFGWYDVREVQQPDPAQPKRDKYSLQIDQITLTEWGHQCLTVLLRDRPFRSWNRNTGYYIYFEDTEKAESAETVVANNTFVEPLRTLLGEPDLLSLYPINSKPLTGVFWLRAELPNHKVSRTIAMPAEATLDDFHAMIQEAFKFDNDHLYEFYLNIRNPYQGERYGSPWNEWSESPPADAVTLAQLNLYEGQRLLYVFDLGDRWEFQITVVKHLPNEKAGKVSIIEKVGKAPKQY